MKQRIWSFDTSIWYQALHKDDCQGYILERFYKDIDRSSLINNVLQLSHLSYPFVLPEIDDLGVVNFKISNSDTLFSMIHRGDEQVVDLFTKLGRFLATARKEPNQSSNVPPAWVRLQNYLSDGYPDSVEDLRTILGDTTLERALSLVRYISNCPGIVGLGGVGLGGIYVFGDSVEFPVGPESGALPPEADVAWIIGELTELEHAFQLRGQSAQILVSSGKALIEGFTEYGGEVKTWRLTTLSALRTLLHYFDFTATYPNHLPDDEHSRFVRWLIERAYSVSTLGE